MPTLSAWWRPPMTAALLVTAAVAGTACSHRAAAVTAPATTAAKPTSVGSPAQRAATHPTTSRVPTQTSPRASSPGPVPTRPTVVSPAAAPTTGPSGPTAPAGQPLRGKVIAVDPGHNGGNADAPGVINQVIWNGRENETCDTTGTETDSGYTEARFNFNVAMYVTADLQAEGATVVLTRTSNNGVGPCVTERAAIGNNAHASAAISIHADGGPAGGRGFAVLEPVSDGINAGIIGPSHVLGADIRNAILVGTSEPVSSYDGIDGIQPRDDLAGLNLSTVPKVLVECANMRNGADAALLVTAPWQQAIARALVAGLTTFLTR